MSVPKGPGRIAAVTLALASLPGCYAVEKWDAPLTKGDLFILIFVAFWFFWGAMNFLEKLSKQETQTLREIRDSLTALASAVQTKIFEDKYRDRP